MTALEMQREFERLLVTTYEGFNDREKPDTDTVGHFLTIAQNRYLKETYLSGGLMAVIQDKVNEIPTLVKREIIGSLNTLTSGTFGSSGGTNTGRAYTVNISSLSNKFMFYVRSESKVTISNNLPEYACTNQWVTNDFINYFDIDNVVTTPTNQPILLKPKVFLEKDTNEQLVVITDKYTTVDTVNGFILTYIKQPQDIKIVPTIQNCELPIHMHEPIVKLAVDSYVLEYKFRLQTRDNQQQTT